VREEMSEEIKPIDKRALLNETGKPKVHVDPKTGTVSTKPTARSVPIDKTTWWGATGGRASSPIFSNPEIKEKLRYEVMEMAVYFPDFDLYSNGETFWQGEIEGMGKVKVTYPETYPAQKFSIKVIDLDEGFNESLKQHVWSYDGITPVGAIIVAMRLFLRDKVAMR
jgi:hypothetical protein